MSDKEKEKEFTNDSEQETSDVSKRKKRSYKKKPKQREFGILIVEDEIIWLNLYKTNLIRLLRKDRKYRIFEARNFKDALKIIIQFYDRIDVILLDLVLGIDQEVDKPEGLNLVEALYDRFGLTDLAIFVLTAYADESMKDSCTLRGVRYFCDKSQLDFEKLSSLIDEYIDLMKKPKGTDVGFYLELRKQAEQSYFYLKWKYGEKDWDNHFLGNTKEIERIALPNIITDLDSFDDWQPKD